MTLRVSSGGASDKGQTGALSKTEGTGQRASSLSIAAVTNEPKLATLQRRVRSLTQCAPGEGPRVSAPRSLGTQRQHSCGLFLPLVPPPLPGLWPLLRPQERSGMVAEPFLPPVLDSSPSGVPFSEPAGTGAPRLRNCMMTSGKFGRPRRTDPLSAVPLVTTATSPLPSQVTCSQVGSRDQAADVFGGRYSASHGR